MFDNEMPMHGGFKCRHKPTLIYRLGDIEVFGASGALVTRTAVEGMDLIVNLTGTRKFKPAKIISAGAKWRELKAVLMEGTPLDEMVLDWPDMGVLDAPREFWVKFWELLNRDRVKRVLFFCVGGHGRTGSAIGCLATVALNAHGGQIIREIRDTYCKNAIETRAQENYVRSMTVKKEKGVE